eukprot:gene6272-7448_t
MAKQAPVLWAQREDCIYLTVEVPDVKDPKVDIQGTTFAFKAKGGPNAEDFEANIELYGEIDPEQSKQRTTGRHVFFVLQKKETGPYWPQLTKQKIKYPWLKVDFNMWKDEDESDDEAGAGPGVPGDMGDMSSLMQQFNAGGMNFDMPSGGMDDDEGPDSDDDDIPGLEQPEEDDEKKE